MSTNRSLRVGKNQDVLAMEQTEHVDDNFLPKASEIEALQRIDNNAMTWLMNMAEREQKFRHESHFKRVDVTNNHSQREHNTARCALLIYFVLVMACVGAAFVLVREGHNLQGTLFGGTAVILGLAVLVAKAPSKQPKPPNEVQKKS